MSLGWIPYVHCFNVQEIELLRSLSFDANIVQFYGACLQEENTMMVLEFMAVRLLFHMVTCTSYSLSAHSVCSFVCVSCAAFLVVCHCVCFIAQAVKMHNMLVTFV